MSDEANHGISPNLRLELVELYPDLVEQGSLAGVMALLAQGVGIELGEISTRKGDAQYITANFAFRRGEIRVVLGAELRWFSMTIAGQGHVWASGGSTDLLEIVQVIDSWRKGIGVEDLQSRFPFMELGNLSVAYERGDPIAEQWVQLLQDRDLTAIHELLLAAHSDLRLRSLFPYVTHLTLLRMMRDHKDRAAGEVWITQRTGGFRVNDPNTDSSLTVNSVEEAIAVAASLI